MAVTQWMRASAREDAAVLEVYYDDETLFLDRVTYDNRTQWPCYLGITLPGGTLLEWDLLPNTSRTVRAPKNEISLAGISASFKLLDQG